MPQWRCEKVVSRSSPAISGRLYGRPERCLRSRSGKSRCVPCRRRLVRDARLVGIHPANSFLTHEVVAKTALGISLDEQPRWGWHPVCEIAFSDTRCRPTNGADRVLPSTAVNPLAAAKGLESASRLPVGSKYSPAQKKKGSFVFRQSGSPVSNPTIHASHRTSEFHRHNHRRRNNAAETNA